ncbi:hemolysin III family protein, partial [Erwinia amylovora]|nr:hemolysin III family protein [Erwinia amylovora]
VIFYVALRIHLKMSICLGFLLGGSLCHFLAIFLFLTPQ